MNRSFLIILVMIMPAAVFGQQWQWEASMELPRSTAFQNIFLPPHLSSLLNPDYGNLRLYDETGEAVPFLMFSEEARKQEVGLKWYKKVREDYWARWYSRSYFRNSKANQIDRMVLKIRNADVTQHFWLSGSDDMKHWYIIKEDYAYDADWDPGNSYNLMTIDFPPVDYKYYKVEIRHHWRESIQILAAGYYAINNVQTGRYQKVPEPEIVQHENGNESLIDIHFGSNYYMDRLFFEIDGPDLYHRTATLEERVFSEDGVVYYKPLTHFTLTSKDISQLEFERLRASAFRLRIQNKDDKPLRIVAAQAHELRKYMTAKLEKGKRYTIKVGKETLRSPEYDLEYFVNDLPEKRAMVKIQDLTLLGKLKSDSLGLSQINEAVKDTANGSPADQAADEASKTEPLLQSKTFLWGGIILIVVLLGFMAFRMLGDMNQEES